MSAQQAAYEQIESVILADTGSGGLRQTAGNGLYVYSIQRFGDQQRTNNWPAIIIQFSENEESPMAATQVVNLGIRFVIETGRDAADTFTKQDAVANRLNALFRRVALTSKTDNTTTWSFSPMERLGAGQNVPGGKTNQFVVPFACVARGT